MANADSALDPSPSSQLVSVTPRAFQPVTTLYNDRQAPGQDIPHPVQSPSAVAASQTDSIDVPQEGAVNAVSPVDPNSNTTHGDSYELNARAQPSSLDPMATPSFPTGWVGVQRPIDHPGLTYTDRNVYRHRDVLSRVWEGPDDDRYLSPTDGRLQKLVVQATEAVRRGPRNATWSRTNMREVTPIHLRVVFWVLKDRIEGRQEEVTAEMCLKWLPACAAIFALLFVPADLGGEVLNNGFYEQFKYHFWGYSYIPSNPREATGPPTELPLTSPWDVNGIAERPLRPRYLCFLTEGDGVEPMRVDKWEKEHGREAILQYVFISYTSAQFQGKEDWEALHVIAAAAARSAGVSAYWISCSCMPEPDQVAEDVFRISDVVRGAHSLAIILGPPVTDPSSDPDMDAMLRHWGERIWTFPEVLLSPTERPISIYNRNGDISNPLLVAKRNFPAKAWEDAPVSRQLVDHYEGSIILSPLELVTLALQCLSMRADNTRAFLPGDLTYVLMGLLRRRPRVNPENTAFQEFCRLSLANDSNRLLERLVCLFPNDRNQPWHHIDDVWGRSLWDISPLCQVDGVGRDDTVILGGGFAAPIRYKSFSPVNLRLRNTVKRMVARFAVRIVPMLFILGVTLLAGTGSRGGDFGVITALGWLFMGPAILMTLASPYLLASLYVGKPWRAQPWLFGFEGYMNITEIETLIFGTNLHRLKWSPYSSPLSRHENINGECFGVDPTEDSATRDLVTRCRESTYGEEKVFTIVDTNLMTVTLYTAVRPPVALVLCGSEGGMQRGLLCSYDWTTQTLYRESVMRVDTMVLERMNRIDRFRLGLKRPLATAVVAAPWYGDGAPQAAQPPNNIMAYEGV
ncbi:uncharacterized protein BJX67DRAFT_385432 [Aspergillus lucknowensis]|uniref:3-hydroxyisobutyrate dehydrogenase protein n=1 Tax=Aspergillus lucknowensis TaxID=176173 RepID=A0ABR4LDL3_9EURO